MKKPISEKERLRKVEVVDHDASWKTIFRHESSAISKILGSNLIAAHHIGSTAISFIKAKPIIDILLVVKDLEQLDNSNDAMRKFQYEPMGEYGIVGRRFYFKDNNNVRAFHVHAFQKGNTEIDRHLNFIRYLQDHPDIAKEYSLLKENLAKQFPNDIQSYLDGKNDFVKNIDSVIIAKNKCK